MDHRIQSAAVLALSVFIASCATSGKETTEEYYSHGEMMLEVAALATEYPDIITVQNIASTHEGRSIPILAISASAKGDDNPGVMALFGQHAGEHVTTKVAMDVIRKIVAGYGHDRNVTELLGKKTLYIVPMVNPDGIDFDLGAARARSSWRKNRAPTGSGLFGVDLNRNWGYQWDAPVPERLMKRLYDPKDEYYHGSGPFSEIETRAIRDFIVDHKNIGLLIDYHAGTSGAMQGNVIIPFTYAGDSEVNRQETARYAGFADELCRIISDQDDDRAGFEAMHSYSVKDFIVKNTPAWQRPFVKRLLPPSTIAPGSSIDWAASRGIPSLGIEILYDAGAKTDIPSGIDRLMGLQYDGFMFLAAMAAGSAL